MSNIYIQEPPTYGKVLLETSVGDVDIELWSKETPKACRNFVQLCLENYYNGTIFHRVVKGFIIQGGDPTGTGNGGESIYGNPFKDEFHSRLRFVRRGLVAMANAGRDDNGSQFFFTLGPTPELQGKHTVFGKVTGDTLFNMIKMEDALVDKDDKPLYPHRIIRTKVLHNPFDDIVPRSVPKENESEIQTKKASKTAVKKNFSLLSFGEEAEEDEEETLIANQKFSSKSKSSHDLTNDPHLSSVPAVTVAEELDSDAEGDSAGSESEEQPRKRKRKKAVDDPTDDIAVEQLEKIRKKLQKEIVKEESKEELTLFSAENKDREKRKETKVLEIKSEIRKLKQQMAKAKKEKEPEDEKQTEMTKPISEAMTGYLKEKEKYKSKMETIKKKGASREAQTLAILAKFQDKLSSAKELHMEKEDNLNEDDGKMDDDDNDDGWLVHKLKFEDSDPVLAKDANMKQDDWFDIYDPRNPINKRRREANTVKDKR